MVALLAEGVDRNGVYHRDHEDRHRVALLAEGVDRNTMLMQRQFYNPSRPPRGGRG